MTEPTDEQVIALYRTGKSIETVAAELTMKVSRARKILETADVLRPRGGITATERATLTGTAVRLYAAGRSIQAIADEVGRSYGFIQRALKVSDVTMRRRGTTAKTPASQP